MDDFAAAAMLRVIGLGLRRQGIAVPMLPAGAARGARLPLADKRRLLEQLHAQHGARVLLRIGEGVHDARDEPALTALTLARDPLDLVERWQRLERFVHSRHRIVAERGDDECVHLRHVSLAARQPPTAAEDLLVMGLLVALAERLGAAAMRAHPAQAPEWAYRQGAWPEADAPVVDLSRWTLAWTAAARPAAAPLVTNADWTHAAYRLLASDLTRRWTLPALAAALHTSSRSLQRQLQAGGSSFSALWLEVRLAQSARLLAASRQPPAQVGYVCGFSDQAHFTRAFKLHTAMTPLKYRERFVLT